MAHSSTPIVTVPRYLAAVRTMHSVKIPEMARALGVSPSIVRRWMGGSLIPSYRRVRGMTALWGGNAELLGLGAALQRYCRTTGVSLEAAVRMVRSGRATGPERQPVKRARDRDQLPLPIQRSNQP